MPKKTMYIEQDKAAPQIAAPRGQDNVIRIPSSKPVRPKLAFPLMIFAVASALFLLAYAGPSIGIVLAYMTIPMLSVFPGLLVWERHGNVAGILAALLTLAILTPVYGTAVLDNFILLFTSLQVISKGVLTLFGIITLVLGLLLFVVGKRGK